MLNMKYVYSITWFVNIKYVKYEICLFYNMIRKYKICEIYEICLF